MITTFINELSVTITLADFININLECGKTIEEALQLASTLFSVRKYKYIRIQGRLVEIEETKDDKTSTFIADTDSHYVSFRYTPTTAYLFKSTIELLHDSYQYEPIVINPLV